MCDRYIYIWNEASKCQTRELPNYSYNTANLTSKEKKFPVSVVEGTQTEANKYGCRTKECCYNNTENIKQVENNSTKLNSVTNFT